MVVTSVRLISGAVFRVRGIPPGFDGTSLAELLVKEFAAEVGFSSEFHVEALELSPSCVRPNTFTALVEFKPSVPERLECLQYNDVISISLDRPGRRKPTIYIDRDFGGLTQLYPTSPETEIIAEYVNLEFRNPS